MLAGATKRSISVPIDLVRAYGLTQTPLDDTWCAVHYSLNQSLNQRGHATSSANRHNATSAALYHHDIVNNLCHTLPFVPLRWSPNDKPPAADAFVANLKQRWHVAYALEFVIYHPPLEVASANYLRSKALRLRDLQMQHQHFIGHLPVQDSYWQQRPDGTYSGSFLVSKWHIMMFARRFDEGFAKLGYKRFGAWAPYSFASPPADR